MKANLIIWSILLLTWVASLDAALGQGTAFTYQGRLLKAGVPAEGHYDLYCALFEAGTGGAQVGSTRTNVDVAVSGGLFTITLDFGATVFDGHSRWLEIGVRTNGSAGDYTTLTPRQALLPAPYTIHAASAAGLMSLANAPLDMKVGGQRAFRIEMNADDTPNVIGGSTFNETGSSVRGATIAGGGGRDEFGNLQFNSVSADFGTVGGGTANAVERGANRSSVGGGYANRIRLDSSGATIAGGWANEIQTNSVGGTISGGERNSIGPFAWGSAISGGFDNQVLGDAFFAAIGGGERNTNSGRAATISGGEGNLCARDYATVAGGSHNRAADYFTVIGGGLGNFASDDFCTVGGGWENMAGSDYATVSGGWMNWATGESSVIGGGALNRASGDSATVGGGYDNSVSGFESTVSGGGRNTAVGAGATIPGGLSNFATNHAFAAGYQAHAIHSGSFVWGDATDAVVASTASNQFTVRATGGARFLSDSDQMVGVGLAPGGTAWATLSDRDAKKGFQSVDTREVLETLARVPVQRWHYRWEQDHDTPNLGPVAQDFKRAFFPGREDKTITTLEFDGVALAAIQGLNQKLEEELAIKAARIETLEKSLVELRELVGRLASPSRARCTPGD